VLNKKNFPLFFMLAFFAAGSYAQQQNSDRPLQFHSINNVGLLEGQTGSAFQLQTINGAQYKPCFAGIGVGLDYYRFRTIPLFIDLRKEFGKAYNKFFVYADAGILFSWVTDKQKMLYVGDDKFSNGFYSDAGIGYKIAVGRNNSLLINVGYSFKNLNETYKQPLFSYGIQALYGQQEKNSYSLNRVSIKMGWEF
jgi:hypothetical protein